MYKILQFIIEMISWISIFLSPVLFGCALAFMINIYYNDNNFILAVIVVTSILFGIFWAERVRKKYGCSNYISKIYGGW